MRLLVTVAAAGTLVLLGLVMLARSSAPRRASWLLVHARMIADCEKANRARGVEAGLTTRYCSCLQGAVETRCDFFDYRNRYRTYARELEADGTVARCAERGPSPATAADPGVRRLGWASSDTAMLSECAAAGRAHAWPEGRTKTYCRGMAEEIESRWSADEYRTSYAEIARDLSASGGAVERCSSVSEGISTR